MNNARVAVVANLSSVMDDRQKDLHGVLAHIGHLEKKNRFFSKQNYGFIVHFVIFSRAI